MDIGSPMMSDSMLCEHGFEQLVYHYPGEFYVIALGSDLKCNYPLLLY